MGGGGGGGGAGRGAGAPRTMHMHTHAIGSTTNLLAPRSQTGASSVLHALLFCGVHLDARLGVGVGVGVRACVCNQGRDVPVPCVCVPPGLPPLAPPY